ncbi:MAG: PD40 domain-containing protein [Opitutaceae bacterium]|nr:PD40 domain-containing protein [Opitutaceae bacterium]
MSPVSTLAAASHAGPNTTSPTVPRFSLICAVRSWDGDYVSRNIPGGVETTPVRSEFWRISFDGTVPTPIRIPGPRVEHPVTSPDGQWLIWQSQTHGQWQVVRGRPDGTEAQRIGPPPELERSWPSAFGAAFSLDGSRLAYTVHNGREGRTVLARADGSRAQLVAPEFGYAYMAFPDSGSDRIVCSGPAQGYRLALLTAGTGAAHVLTPDLPDCYAPQFSSDGKTIVFIRRDGGLWRIGADGTELRLLATGLEVEFRLSAGDLHGSTDFPSIAPEGSQVAYIARDSQGVPNVFTVSLEGGHPLQRTRHLRACGRVRWSPDGRWLAYVAFDEGRLPQLHLLAVEGEHAPQPLTTAPGAVYSLTWLNRSSG